MLHTDRIQLGCTALASRWVWKIFSSRETLSGYPPSRRGFDFFSGSDWVQFVVGTQDAFELVFALSVRYLELVQYVVPLPVGVEDVDIWVSTE